MHVSNKHNKHSTCRCQFVAVVPCCQKRVVGCSKGPFCSCNCNCIGVGRVYHTPTCSAAHLQHPPPAAPPTCNTAYLQHIVNIQHKLTAAWRGIDQVWVGCGRTGRQGRDGMG